MNDNITLLNGGYRSRRPPARITTQDRMQPSLLDKLTDKEPDKKREISSNYLLSNNAVRKNILRDLEWLLNSLNKEPDNKMLFFPEICHSVYNFGLTPLAGRNMSEIEWNDIQEKIIKAIHTFEPRIIPDELQVNCISDKVSISLYNILSIEIKGFLWCVPWPIEFLFLSDIDLENSHFNIKDAG
ncbi:type VI secretion system baseplate subunit TssE [Xenorhabdus sp. Sc-CR9]|uniref:type VI secretion system baseplate subunit TssE n=1 Tax=Xenorhabdus sp. Sc-CR9 TaxID=2584468 RepID=UPI001EFFAF2F|nr:type VI secretion system baseplate subunit TssE [Xenorhabdus sp. Sc-CR9]